jgi:fatty acid amide hydrolase
MKTASPNSSAALWSRSAVDLSAALARREVSSREVVGAHLARIGQVEARIHAFTEVLRDEALAEADASDTRRARGESIGALDGLPVTLKECFDFAGRATTLGIDAWRDRRADRDAAMVTLLRAAGAVPLGRTNLSQAMLYVEARNPVYGRTANPFSPAHAPGGSSGGEAAALAAGMSPLGVGTDIGGSIRTPCAFSGVCGIKPTLDRLPMRGYRTVLAGQEAVRGMGGPMARTVADLALFFAAIDPDRAAALDPRVPPLRWDAAEAARVRSLRVGAYVRDGVIEPSAAVARAVQRARLALAARGCEVVDFAPPDVPEVLEQYLGALSADGGAGLLRAIGGGEVDPVLEPLRRMASVPGAVRSVLGGAASLFGQPRIATMLRALGEKSVARLWSLTDALRVWRSKLLDAMDAARVDVLLCPPFATPAVRHGESKNFTLASSYSIVFNVAQLPAGVVPVGRVRPDETTRRPGGDALEKQAARIDEASAGLPVGVQVVGRAWKESVVLAVMEAIEGEVRDHLEFPRTPVEPRDGSQP